jgi:hypothetical protein
LEKSIEHKLKSFPEDKEENFYSEEKGVSDANRPQNPLKAKLIEALSSLTIPFPTGEVSRSRTNSLRNGEISKAMQNMELEMPQGQLDSYLAFVQN